MGGKKILAIGGAVIKTAKEELRQYIEAGNVEMLIHNGGSIFHDFQNGSIPLDDLLDDFSCNKDAAVEIMSWFYHNCPCPHYGPGAPVGSITRLCQEMGIPILMFTVTYGDFWQLFTPSVYEHYMNYTKQSWGCLVARLSGKYFHYINMGSAVVHPEVFIKAVAFTHAKNFRADVVDFKPDMYRPLTRVAKYGEYYCMRHKEWFKKEGIVCEDN